MSSISIAAANTTNSGNNASSIAVTSEVEETLSRIRSHKGVEGIIVMNREGATIQSTLNEEQTLVHAALLSQLAAKATSLVETIDMGDELSFLRIRSRNREIMVAPDKEFLLVVIQNPNATE
uniref:Roadblock/LAMTOR2 domain-containing protein n=1 Tax=Helicotheca tamesis TaxID=374047 RepID=A0A7S2I9Y4_9STRA|mmetsp:Transcript_7018/g.9496  ORF Transcript_7018/g.9496 Transcript_7018/m.9496 type:complete len:122 (+) Transcript_7018:112-477(+)|eukprot:CAMPEP_0185729066 /NCGR_PEP_ID=MMETSP1171-20130828/4449_1 /TAXON_ID=374046 /ORGANISM="Helicotheca tamensis, Strain CCMP826" /LENGTH=121 /DNA_ID=CAMNT_0028397833 /DNA_START=52 /DNA_END=417 /DNA_ORIENTATION=+